MARSRFTLPSTHTNNSSTERICCITAALAGRIPILPSSCVPSVTNIYHVCILGLIALLTTATAGGEQSSSAGINGNEAENSIDGVGAVYVLR